MDDGGGTLPPQPRPTSRLPSRKGSVASPGNSSSSRFCSCVVKEIVATERQYVGDLRDIRDGYIVCCKGLDILTADDIRDIFGNIEDIYNFNSSFLCDVEDCCEDPVSMAQCFVTRSREFAIYADYCTNYSRSLATLTYALARPAVQEAFRHQQDELGHSLPISSYLHKPVQRVLKYHLLLQNLLKYFDGPAEGRAVIDAAFRSMCDMASHINEAKRAVEHAMKVQQLLSDLNDVEDGNSPSDFGSLIMDSDFRLLGAKSLRHLFLFEKGIALAKKHDDGSLHRKCFITCSNLMLIESVPKEPLCFHLIPFDSPRTLYALQARTAEEKRLWCVSIKRLILDSYAAGAIPDRSKQLVLSIGLSASSVEVAAAVGQPFAASNGSNVALGSISPTSPVAAGSASALAPTILRSAWHRSPNLLRASQHQVPDYLERRRRKSPQFRSYIDLSQLKKRLARRSDGALSLPAHSQEITVGASVSATKGDVGISAESSNKETSAVVEPAISVGPSASHREVFRLVRSRSLGSLDLHSMGMDSHDDVSSYDDCCARAEVLGRLLTGKRLEAVADYPNIVWDEAISEKVTQNAKTTSIVRRSNNGRKAFRSRQISAVSPTDGDREDSYRPTSLRSLENEVSAVEGPGAWQLQGSVSIPSLSSEGGAVNSDGSMVSSCSSAASCRNGSSSVAEMFSSSRCSTISTETSSSETMASNANDSEDNGSSACSPLCDAEDTSMTSSPYNVDNKAAYPEERNVAVVLPSLLDILAARNIGGVSALSPGGEPTALTQVGLSQSNKPAASVEHRVASDNATQRQRERESYQEFLMVARPDETAAHTAVDSAAIDSKYEHVEAGLRDLEASKLLVTPRSKVGSDLAFVSPDLGSATSKVFLPDHSSAIAEGHVIGSEPHGLPAKKTVVTAEAHFTLGTCCDDRTGSGISAGSLQSLSTDGDRPADSSEAGKPIVSPRASSPCTHCSSSDSGVSMGTSPPTGGAFQHDISNRSDRNSSSGASVSRRRRVVLRVHARCERSTNDSVGDGTAVQKAHKNNAHLSTENQNDEQNCSSSSSSRLLVIEPELNQHDCSLQSDSGHGKQILRGQRCLLRPATTDSCSRVDPSAATLDVLEQRSAGSRHPKSDVRRWICESRASQGSSNGRLSRECIVAECDKCQQPRLSRHGRVEHEDIRVPAGHSQPPAAAAEVQRERVPAERSCSEAVATVAVSVCSSSTTGGLAEGSAHPAPLPSVFRLARQYSTKVKDKPHQVVLVRRISGSKRASRKSATEDASANRVQGAVATNGVLAPVLERDSSLAEDIDEVCSHGFAAQCSDGSERHNEGNAGVTANETVGCVPIKTVELANAAAAVVQPATADSRSRHRSSSRPISAGLRERMQSLERPALTPRAFTFADVDCQQVETLKDRVRMLLQSTSITGSEGFKSSAPARRESSPPSYRSSNRATVTANSLGKAHAYIRCLSLPVMPGSGQTATPPPPDVIAEAVAVDLAKATSEEGRITSGHVRNIVQRFQIH